MAKKGESRRQAKIHRYLKRTFRWHGWKIHGSMFQAKGIPDLVGCVAGLFFGLEVKMPKGRVSEEQKEQIRLIKKAGGHATVVVTPEDADRFIRGVLREEGLLLEGSKAAAKASSRVRFLTAKEFMSRERVTVQATPGEDLHRRRRHRTVKAKKDARYRPSHK